MVYSFGVGEDISFDLSLIEKFGLEVFAFDPTPRSMNWVRSQKLPSKFHLFEYGIFDYDDVAELHPPRNPAHISHTLLSLPGSQRRGIKVRVYRLKTIMEMLGHTRIDVLKLDIEGAEYRVLRDILNSDLAVSQILVEFHHRMRGISVHETISAVHLLNRKGYRIFHISESGENYSFIRLSGEP